MKRGVWELSTARLEQLAAALARRAGEEVTLIGLQRDGFEAATCGHLAGMPASAARVVVEAMVADRAAHPRPGLELVWSGPEGGPTLSRDTSQVLWQLFSGAEQRVLVAGFAFYEASDIFAPLHARAMAGVAVEFFIHVDGSGHDARMTPESFFRWSWPWRDALPHVYYDTRADDVEASSTMHAKCVVVDDREVLITSANFTARAQRHNVELGALVRDRTFASRVSGQWRALAGRGLFKRHPGP